MRSRPLPRLTGLRHPADRSPPPSGAEPARVGPALRRAFSIPSLAAGVVILGFLLVVALGAVQRDFGHLATLSTDPALAANPYPPGPSMAHPLGEMSGIGVDELAALWQATPWDLALIGGILLLGIVVGALLGAYAGLRPGIVRETVGSVSDLMVAVPPFFLVWVLVLNVDLAVPLSAFVAVFVGAFSAVLCFGHARAVLPAARIVAAQPYAEAARASGASDAHLLFRHILPNSFSAVWAQVPVDLYSVLFLLTAFPFVGCLDVEQLQSLGSFGTASPFPTAPFPEWGNLLAAGACSGLNVVTPFATWWMWVFPTGAILLFAAGVTLLSEGLQRFFLGRR